MSAFIKPIQTRPPEYYEETATDGESVRVEVEHFRQGDHFYSITWRDGEEPVVADEAPEQTEEVQNA